MGCRRFVVSSRRQAVPQFGPAIRHGALGKLRDLTVLENAHQDEHRPLLPHGLLETDQHLLDAVEMVGVRIAGTLRHFDEVEVVQFFDGNSRGRDARRVVEHEVHQVRGLGFPDGGESAKVGAQGGVAVQHQHPARLLGQGQSQSHRGGTIHAVHQVKVEFPPLRDSAPLPQRGGGRYDERISAVVAYGAGRLGVGNSGRRSAVR
ncbi:hypothetical protein GBAR_LOCUS19734 [Geodia barretti]|uniref:Uncharacterized protein n=1 Tax=Geodia barretti TaxID=519541 RepID=A0AA35X221_GEOBA|nr:hypothetical protein GBAR_LOCUS19734 [Geodia barretti]